MRLPEKKLLDAIIYKPDKFIKLKSKYSFFNIVLLNLFTSFFFNSLLSIQPKNKSFHSFSPL